MASHSLPTGRERSKFPRDDGDLVAADARENLLIFQLAGAAFGLRLVAVAEIIRLPDLAHMPLVPPSLLGLANLRGVVLPVVSLRALLRLPDRSLSALTRVVVIRGTAPVGFVVDSIDRLLTIARDQIEQDERGAGTIDPALLDGLITGAEGESAIKLLSPSRVLSGQFEKLGISSAPAVSPTSRVTGRSVGVAARAPVSLLSFDLGTQEYALPLDRIREILPMPDHVSELPGPETAVLGVVTLRHRLLPLVSLRALLGLPAAVQLGQRGKVVVITIGGGIVGMVVDATREILRLDPELVDPAPALLSRGKGEAEISSLCRLDGGRRLVALLSPDRVFRSDLVKRILDEQVASVAGLPEANAMADEQFIIFRLANQDYGIPIAAVSEIARPPEHITRLPKAPAFIDGVMNLRGGVVPIVDLRRRFDVGASEPVGSQRILILEFGHVIAGFLVDSVAEILKVPIDSICPAPDLSTEQMRLISRVVNLEASGRLILVVDPLKLLDQVEADVLANFDSARFDAPVTAS